MQKSRVKNKPKSFCFIVLLPFCNKFLLQKGKKRKGQRVFSREEHFVKLSLCHKTTT